MTKLKRRSFLQLVGASVITPFMPSMPAMRARAAVATGGTSVSKALWASMYANSGSTTGFVSMSKSMGLSNAAIQGVGARSAGVRIALAATGEKLKGAAVKQMRSSVSTQSNVSKLRKIVQQRFEQYLSKEYQLQQR